MGSRAGPTGASRSAGRRRSFTFEGGKSLTFYVNGQQTDTTAAPAQILDDPQANLRIGCRGDSAYFFVGLIDEVRIYGRALAPAEIAALAAQ
jgi:hypothetical protein